MVANGRVEEPLIYYIIPTQTFNRCLSVLSVDSLFLCPTRTFRFRCPLSKRRHPRTSGWTWSYPPVDDLVRRKGWSQSLSLSLLILSQNFFDLLSRVLWERRRGHWKDEICALYITFFSSPPTILLVSRGQPCFCSLWSTLHSSSGRSIRFEHMTRIYIIRKEFFKTLPNSKYF